MEFLRFSLRQLNTDKTYTVGQYIFLQSELFDVDA